HPNPSPPSHYSQVTLARGEMLVIYTDGLVENKKAGKKFDLSSLEKLILQHQRDDLHAIVETIFAALHEFYAPDAIEDDATLLLIRRVDDEDESKS
ncbi:MAG: SpoIIE family protein phosphatase, partial [Gammaproteobacteria bacterium]|nr:SpoIIE family protein phosphatase [Gammaproteobacteria bacterium]